VEVASTVLVNGVGKSKTLPPLVSPTAWPAKSVMAESPLAGVIVAAVMSVLVFLAVGTAGALVAVLRRAVIEAMWMALALIAKV
jgi:hypothetical protein